MMRSDDGACASARGCCQSKPATSGREAVVADSSTPPSVATEAREGAPSGSCCCRPGTPEAPNPKPRRTTSDERSGPARSGSATWVALAPALTPPAVAVPPAASPPPKSPLYLRTSRLLI
jgi:hypothetical protein